MRKRILRTTVLAPFVFLYSAVLFASPPTNFQRTQNPSNKSSQARPQKVQNPLNDLLDDAQTALDKNNFESAIPPLQKFLAEKPDVAFAHFQLAYAYTGLNRVDEARTEFTRAAGLAQNARERTT